MTLELIPTPITTILAILTIARAATKMRAVIKDSRGGHGRNGIKFLLRMQMVVDVRTINDRYHRLVEVEVEERPRKHQTPNLRGVVVGAAATTTIIIMSTASSTITTTIIITVPTRLI